MLWVVLLLSFLSEGFSRFDMEGFEMVILKSPKQCDREVMYGDKITVHYVTWDDLQKKVVFNSYEHNAPHTFQVGYGEVITGFEKGIVGMCVGEVRQLTIPPKLGPSENRFSVANATLKFQVALDKIEDGDSDKNVFKKSDLNGDNLISREEATYFMTKEIIQFQPNITEAQINDAVNELFEVDDKDGNGFLSLKEFSRQSTVKIHYDL